MGKCEHHMKVGGIDYLRPAFIYPDFLKYCLTVRAVPIAAGIPVVFYMSAFPAPADIESEPAGLAGHDRTGGPLLFF